MIRHINSIFIIISLFSFELWFNLLWARRKKSTTLDYIQNQMPTFMLFLFASVVGFLAYVIWGLNAFLEFSILLLLSSVALVLNALSFDYRPLRLLFFAILFANISIYSCIFADVIF